MKRVTGIAIFLVLLISAAAFAEECCIYGFGTLKGRVFLCGNSSGQEDAYVYTTGGPFQGLNTWTDAGGYYCFEKVQLPACLPTNGRVYASFCWVSCCGAPPTAWAASTSFYFRKLNQGECITVNKNLTMLYAGLCR